jgi:hypothetical protein
MLLEVDQTHTACGTGQRHIIYIWSRDFANITKVIEGPSEGFADMVVR